MFRASTRKQALSHGLTGWVQNNNDGSVEGVFEGKRENVDRVVRWCRRGPWGAHVVRVDVKEEKYTGDLSTFSIKYSYY